MEHAEARERLAEAATDPRELSRLAAGLAAPGPAVDDEDLSAVGADETGAPAEGDLVAHLAVCAACRRDLSVWLATSTALRDALAVPDLLPSAVPSDPAALRAATLARVHASVERRARPSGAAAPVSDLRRRLQLPGSGSLRRLRGSMSMPRPLLLTGVAVVVAALLVGTLVTTDLAAQRDRAQVAAAHASDLTATMTRVLQEPGAHVSALHAPGATAGAGVLVWGPSSGTLVVLSQALEAPPAGSTYVCWIDENGQRVVVGRMLFDGGLAYWAGPLDGWTSGDVSGRPFGVSRAIAPGGSVSAPVLVGTL